jgi:hypothetical protein
MFQAGTMGGCGFGRIAWIVAAKRLGANNWGLAADRTVSGTDALWRSAAQSLVPKGEGDQARPLHQHGPATGCSIGSPVGYSAHFHPDGRVCHLCRC